MLPYKKPSFGVAFQLEACGAGGGILLATFSVTWSEITIRKYVGGVWTVLGTFAVTGVDMDTIEKVGDYHFACIDQSFYRSADGVDIGYRHGTATI